MSAKGAVSISGNQAVIRTSDTSTITIHGKSETETNNITTTCIRK